VSAARLAISASLDRGLSPTHDDVRVLPQNVAQATAKVRPILSGDYGIWLMPSSSYFDRVPRRYDGDSGGVDAYQIAYRATLDCRSSRPVVTRRMPGGLTMIRGSQDSSAGAKPSLSRNQENCRGSASGARRISPTVGTVKRRLSIPALMRT